MKSQINYYSEANGWKYLEQEKIDANIVLYFISPDVKDVDKVLQEIKSQYPNAQTVGLTTGGEIFNEEVSHSTVSIAAIQLENTPFQIVSLPISNITESEEIGEKLGRLINKDDLNSVMLFSDGLKTNGTGLIKGLTSVLGHDVKITGGLAGDNEKFERTKVGLNKSPEEGQTVAIAYYGNHLVYGHGSAGGWDNFGPQRLITRAEGNVLYTLDNKPALELYKRYLTEEQVKDLPGSGLLYPLSIQSSDSLKNDTVRTIVGIDEKEQSLIFAGDIPQGHMARLMMGSFDRLIDGASTAAEQACALSDSIEGDSLTLMISCIGRRLLMGQQISGEAEAVYDTLKKGSKAIGFYSYGEIAPNPSNNLCQLQNQTMTITHFGEKKAA